MIVTRYKESFNRAILPLARAVARSGISPTAITLAAPVIVSGLCFYYVRTRATVPFCFLVLLAGLLDALDGAVARASGRASKLGAYLDAMVDRYVEFIVVLAAAWVSGHWALSSVMLGGALLVSYAKARAAMEVPVSNLEWPDLAERTERSIIFLAGLLLSALTGWTVLGRDLFWWTLALLCVLTHLTVVQRMLRARRYIVERGSA